MAYIMQGDSEVALSPLSRKVLEKYYKCLIFLRATVECAQPKQGIIQEKEKHEIQKIRIPRH